MNKYRNFTLLGFGTIGFLFLIAKALGDDNKLGSHGGWLLSNGFRDAEVTIREKTSKIEVYLLRESNESPSEVVLTLFDEKDRPLTFELQAIPYQDPSLSAYQGSFNPLLDSLPGKFPFGSYFGIELRIPLSKGAPDVLRSEP